MQELAGKWAVITGASAGIGEHYAREFAALGMHLIIVARREDRLQSLAAELREQHGTIVEVVTADLLADDHPAELLERIEQIGQPIEVLINNAGFGFLERVSASEPDRVQEMITLNISVLTRLTYALIPQMVSRGSGTIINLSSVAAFQPTVYMPVYAATKTFVLHFSESLWAELRDQGVQVQAVCPGPTKSEFFERAGMRGWYINLAHETSDVVAATLRGMRRRKSVSGVGWLNWLLAVTPRFSPRKLVVTLSERILRPKGS